MTDGAGFVVLSYGHGKRNPDVNADDIAHAAVAIIDFVDVVAGCQQCC